MNPTLSFSLLKPVNDTEISSLESTGDSPDGLSKPLFAGEFEAAIAALLPSDGNITPHDIAGLRELDVQQFTNLVEQRGIELSPELLLQLKQLAQDKPLGTLAAETAILPLQINPLARPIDSAESLKTNLMNDDVIGQTVLDELQVNRFNQVDLNSKTIPFDVLQTASAKKDLPVTQIINDKQLDMTDLFKGFVKPEMEVKNELLNLNVKQDINPTKLVDQFASIDKAVTFVNPTSTAPTQSPINQETGGLFLRRVDVPVNQAAWGEAVGQRLMTMVNDKMQSAHIHLNPSELGPIEVRVNVNQDQASVHFVSNHSAVRDAIEEAFPRLREMFLQNGLSLTDANVSQQSSQQGRSFSSNNDDSQHADMNNPSDVTEMDVTDTKQIHDRQIGLIDHYV